MCLLLPLWEGDGTGAPSHPSAITPRARELCCPGGLACRLPPTLGEWGAVGAQRVAFWTISANNLSLPC